MSSPRSPPRSPRSRRRSERRNIRVSASRRLPNGSTKRRSNQPYFSEAERQNRRRNNRGFAGVVPRPWSCFWKKRRPLYTIDINAESESRHAVTRNCQENRACGGAVGRSGRGFVLGLRSRRGLRPARRTWRLGRRRLSRRRRLARWRLGRRLAGRWLGPRRLGSRRLGLGLAGCGGAVRRRSALLSLLGLSVLRLRLSVWRLWRVWRLRRLWWVQRLRRLWW